MKHPMTSLKNKRTSKGGYGKSATKNQGSAEMKARTIGPSIKGAVIPSKTTNKGQARKKSSLTGRGGGKAMGRSGTF